MEATNETITLNGINYVAESFRSAESLRRSGHDGAANFLEQHSIKRDIVVRRPRGKKLYLMREWENGAREIICDWR